MCQLDCHVRPAIHKVIEAVTASTLIDYRHLDRSWRANDNYYWVVEDVFCANNRVTFGQIPSRRATHAHTHRHSMSYKCIQSIFDVVWIIYNTAPVIMFWLLRVLILAAWFVFSEIIGCVTAAGKALLCLAENLVCLSVSQTPAISVTNLTFSECLIFFMTWEKHETTRLSGNNEENEHK